MAIPAADTGLGATIGFTGLDSGDAPMISIDWDESTIEVLEAATLASTGQVPKIAGDLVDLGGCSCEFLWPSGITPPTVGTLGTLTITWPSRGAAEASVADLEGEAALVSFNYPAMARNELQRGTAAWTWDGQAALVYTSAVAT